jgi:hypothetical protein
LRLLSCFHSDTVTANLISSHLNQGLSVGSGIEQLAIVPRRFAVQSNQAP